jgi:ribosomal protein L30
MAQLKVQQKRSTIGCKANQRNTLRSLGLKRIGHVVVSRLAPPDDDHQTERRSLSPSPKKGSDHGSQS